MAKVKLDYMSLSMRQREATTWCGSCPADSLTWRTSMPHPDFTSRLFLLRFEDGCRDPEELTREI